MTQLCTVEHEDGLQLISDFKNLCRSCRIRTFYVLSKFLLCLNKPKNYNANNKTF